MATVTRRIGTISPIVQSVSGEQWTTPAHALTLNGVTAGNTLVLVMTESVGFRPVTINDAVVPNGANKDSQNNTWVARTRVVNTSGVAAQIFYAANVAGGNTTVRVLQDSGLNIQSVMTLYEVRGTGATPYDDEGGFYSTTSQTTHYAADTTQFDPAADTVMFEVGHMSVDRGAPTMGVGWTRQLLTGSVVLQNYNVMAWKTRSAAGVNERGEWTQATGSNGTAAIASFVIDAAYVRDYSTISLWEADLDNTSIYASGDAAIGECYADSAFDEQIVINGGSTVGLASIKLTVPTAQRHDGTAGTGARIVKTATAVSIFDLRSPVTDGLAVEWLDVNANGVAITTIISNNSATNGRIARLRNLLVHGNSTNSTGCRGIFAQSRDAQITNCVIYNIRAYHATGARESYGIDIDADLSGCGVCNNTVWDVRSEAALASAAVGIYVRSDDTDGRIKNNISAGHSPAAGGAVAAFAFAGTVNVVSANNLSDDATADDGGGSGHVINATAANLFVSNTRGSEDLHLKSGSPAIDVGVDLVTTPTGVNIDIDGRDRDAMGDTWDIGAHEYVSAGGTDKTSSDTLLLTLTDTGSLAADVIATDTLSLYLADVASLEAALSTTDTLTPSFTEVASLVADLVGADITSLSLSEVAASAAELVGADTAAVVVTDATTLLADATSTDAVAVTLSDTPALSADAAATDALLVALADAAALVAAVNASDTLAVLLSENAAVVAALASVDTILAQLVESGTLAEVDAKVSADVLAVVISTASIVAGNVASTDVLLLTLSHGTDVAVTVVGDDLLAIQVASVADVATDLLSSDMATIALSDSASVAATEAKTSNDVLAVTMTDVAAVLAALTGTDTLTPVLVSVAELSALLGTADFLTLGLAHGSVIVVDGLVYAVIRVAHEALQHAAPQNQTVRHASIQNETLQHAKSDTESLES